MSWISPSLSSPSGAQKEAVQFCILSPLSLGGGGLPITGAVLEYGRLYLVRVSYSQGCIAENDLKLLIFLPTR